MRIQNVVQGNNSSNNDLRKTKAQESFAVPSFKGAGALNLVGNIMNGIETQGFLASFLVQDVLGMTAPRTYTAFHRDKEVTGKYNVQEGFEVLGREGMTGPCMMAVAPIMFALTAKIGKSTSVNSQLIRRFGDSLKEVVSSSKFNKKLLTDKSKFKKEFYTKNIKEMLSNTLGKDNVKEESVNFILERIGKIEKIPADAKLPKNKLGMTSKSKYKENLMSEIVEHINNLKYSTSSDLSMLDKLNVGSKEMNSIKSFSTKSAIEGMMKYSDDAITLNKNLDKLDKAAAESLKDSAIGKRFATTIATMAATLGVLSVLPKLYMKSDISPGARTAMQMKEANIQKENNENKGEVSFKGKGPNKSFFSKLGKKLSKFVEKDFVANELEYNGHNFTNSLMAGLSLFGLLTPRGMKAYNRAQIDENGKRDMTEVSEILIRDLTSSLLVVFAVPMLTRAAVTAYEKNSGFVLMHKDRSMSKKDTILNLFNPYSKAHVLKNSEIESLYHGIDSKKKMINFCEYIDKNGGDLQKILSKSDNYKEFMKDNKVNIEELAKLSKKEKNSKLISLFKDFGKGKSEQTINESIKTLMKGKNCTPKNNKILSFARGLNSLPGFIATFLISPLLLGIIIPEITYANTRRIHRKAEAERQAKANKINTAV